MPGKQPLDLRLEIADLYDKGYLSGRTSLDDIATAASAKPTSVRNAIRVLDFTLVKSRTRIMQSVPTRWKPQQAGLCAWAGCSRKPRTGTLCAEHRAPSRKAGKTPIAELNQFFQREVADRDVIIRNLKAESQRLTSLLASVDPEQTVTLDELRAATQEPYGNKSYQLKRISAMGERLFRAEENALKLSRKLEGA